MKRSKYNTMMKELAEITKKYNVTLAGCGCCGSPYLYQDVGEPDKYGNYKRQYIAENIELTNKGTYEADESCWYDELYNSHPSIEDDIEED